MDDSIGHNYLVYSVTVQRGFICDTHYIHNLWRQVYVSAFRLSFCIMSFLLSGMRNFFHSHLKILGTRRR
jgi:hypothetical protein